jgi:hypothetical protein
VRTGSGDSRIHSRTRASRARDASRSSAFPATCARGGAQRAAARRRAHSAWEGAQAAPVSHGGGRRPRPFRMGGGAGLGVGYVWGRGRGRTSCKRASAARQVGPAPRLGVSEKSGWSPRSPRCVGVLGTRMRDGADGSRERSPEDAPPPGMSIVGRGAEAGAAGGWRPDERIELISTLVSSSSPSSPRPFAECCELSFSGEACASRRALAMRCRTRSSARISSLSALLSFSPRAYHPSTHRECFRLSSIMPARTSGAPAGRG